MVQGVTQHLADANARSPWMPLMVGDQALVSGLDSEQG